MGKDAKGKGKGKGKGKTRPKRVKAENVPLKNKMSSNQLTNRELLSLSARLFFFARQNGAFSFLFQPFFSFSLPKDFFCF